MSNDRDHQIRIYLQLPYEKRKILENDFKKLKTKFQLSLPGGESYVANLIQNIANVMIPQHNLSDNEFLGLAHYFTEEEYQSSQDSGESASSEPSGCFVATVCCGNSDQWEVKTLKKFRDRILIKTKVGHQFVHRYYSWGPYAALILEKRRPLYRNMFRLFVIG